MDAESRTGFKALPSSTLPPPNARCAPGQVLLRTVASPASWLQAPRGGGWGRCIGKKTIQPAMLHHIHPVLLSADSRPRALRCHPFS